MSNPDLRGYGSGRGTEVHNDPEAHHRKNLEEAKEVVNRDRLYTDITQCDAVVISDRGEEYGGTTDREIEADQSGITKYTSVIIRFIGPDSNPTYHPDQHKTDPLSAKNKEEFFRYRQNQIIDILGKPDNLTLYERGQTIYFYYIKYHPNCPNVPYRAEEERIKLELRFDALNRSKELYVYNY